MNTDSSPPSVTADAEERAVRTFAQGLLVDAVAATCVALTAFISGGIEWTRAYWIALGLAVAKSLITAVVSYVTRHTVPPMYGEAGR